MNALIIEDEPLAAQQLQTLLAGIDPDVAIVGVLESVRDSVEWLQHRPPPDLAFVDIHLTDDISFEIFKRCQVAFPVIFTTAYDKYILESFECNSIDYVLKPVTEKRLRKALAKVKALKKHFIGSSIAELLNDAPVERPLYRKRILVKKGIDYVPLQAHEIAYFFSEHKMVFVKDMQGTTYIIDKPLNALHQSLDPSLFFRINRKFLANIAAIARFTPLAQGKIRVELRPSIREAIIVSKENAPNFRRWVDR